VANIGHIAQICEDAWADWICAINTAGPGLVIDPYLKAPVLANKVGWLSGPMIKPIALKAINDIYKKVQIPIIWTGWITTWKDAIEAIMCWASILWVWTAVYSRWIEVFWKIAEEMQEFMKAEWIKSLDEIRGVIK
jgi:dihydroorotate dehydrogenase (NAD+) catalytic subunit